MIRIEITYFCGRCGRYHWRTSAIGKLHEDEHEIYCTPAYYPDRECYENCSVKENGHCKGKKVK